MVYVGYFKGEFNREGARQSLEGTTLKETLVEQDMFKIFTETRTKCYDYAGTTF